MSENVLDKLERIRGAVGYDEEFGRYGGKDPELSASAALAGVLT
jgi:hypothetical protein